MRTRRSDNFTTITVEGQILPTDLLQRIVEKDSELGGLTPDSYHLSPGETVNEATSRAWNKLTANWSNFKNTRAKLPATDPGTTITRDRWLLPLFQELGYGRLAATRAAVSIDGKSYAISHWWANVPIHLVGCAVSLDRLSARVAGAARSSPHSLTQELLNRSEESLWGFVSNGLQLRILRDNQNLVRQAYIEFDLEAMMDGEAYSDFVMLWLVCHQSRVEAEKATDYWLEKWSRNAQERGVRALEHLREGVEEAISLLGSGFLAHRANAHLREKLRSGTLDKQDYYRQLLRLVYRLLFLFVAEDRTDQGGRSLLFDPKAPQEACNRYTKFYSTNKLRQLAERRHGSRHSDLYAGLQLVMEKLGSEGCDELALPALGSFLFSQNAIADLNEAEIANHDLLDAVRALAFATDNQARRQIDYKNLGSEELGSVYESLLELHPQLNIDAGTFNLTTAAGHERKTTGSYYTPDSLVQCLLDSTLDPVLANRELRYGELGFGSKEQAILDLKVCDPACGSGHFLIAAAHRIAKRLAAIRTGDEEPSPAANRHALRDVVGRCLYGVDVNPMAVELCKVSLWMEALEPGKPLSFLDHHILCGNSLLGATPALLENGIPDDAFKPIEGDDPMLCAEYKKQNKRERQQESLRGFHGEPWERFGNLATTLLSIEDVSDETIEGIHTRRQRYEELVNSTDYRYGGLLADCWCCAFVWKKYKSSELPYAITEEIFRRIEKNPFSTEIWMEQEIRRLAAQYQFFHWHLAFPGVFSISTAKENSEDQKSGWGGGFSAIIGNPPWERVKFQEKEWFASRRPDIANATNAAARKRIVESLEDEDPSIYRAFIEDKRKSRAEGHLLQDSGRYPLGASGDTNTYSVFVELAESLMQSNGRTGLIVKTGILADFSMRKFFAHLVDSSKLVSAYDFSNKRLIFPAVVANERFTLLTLSNNHTADRFRVSILNEDILDLEVPGRVWSLSKNDLDLINPNTRTCPLFQTARDSKLVQQIYGRLPILVREGHVEENPWGLFYLRMLDMTLDSGLFKDLEELQELSISSPSPDWPVEDDKYLALIEGKLFDSHNFRHGTFAGISRDERFGTKAEPNHPNAGELDDPSYSCLPRYWVPGNKVHAKYKERLSFIPSGILTFRDVCRTHTDVRTVRACINPPWGAGNKAPLLLFPNVTREEHAKRSLLLCANLTSLVFDYVARQKFSGGSLNKYILIQLPVIALKNSECLWQPRQSLFDWITERAIELTYTAWYLAEFAKDCGYGCPPFHWNKERRFLLRSEVDAAFFHLYAINREDAEYILETFPILKRRDEQQYGEYRTKHLILEMYDEMNDAIVSRTEYQTRLNPPPADPRVAHPPRVQPAPIVLPPAIRHPQPDAGFYMMRVILSMLQQNNGSMDVERLMNACELLAMPDRLERYGSAVEPSLAHQWRTNFTDQFRPDLFLPKIDDLVQRGEIRLTRDGTRFKVTRIDTAVLPTDAHIDFDASFALQVSDSLPQAEKDAFTPLATRDQIEERTRAA